MKKKLQEWPHFTKYLGNMSVASQGSVMYFLSSHLGKLAGEAVFLRYI